MVCCYGWSKVDLFFAAWREAGFRPVGHIVFHKSYASKTNFLHYQHEQAFLLAKGSPKQPTSPISDVQELRYSKNELHPTQKPVSALIPLIKSFSRQNDLVVDPFCGSASTCAAALLVGRRFLGIEMDEKYFRVATARMARVRERLAVRQARPSPRFIAICAAPNSKPGWQDRKELPHRRVLFANATRSVWETASGIRALAEPRCHEMVFPA
jgi:DNA modification methylase